MAVNPSFPVGITVQEIDENGKAKRYALSDDKELENSTLDTRNVLKIDETTWLGKIDFDRKGEQHRNLILKMK